MATQFKPAGEFAKFSFGESLSVGDAVCLGESDNEVLKADSGNQSRMPAIGFVKSIRGSNCIIQLSYLMSRSNLSQGSEYWVSSNGGIAASAPSSSGAVVQKIGKAISSNKFLINIESQTITL